MVVIEDTREKLPWNFQIFGCSQERTKVDTGDYTLLGYEDKITIDRKKSISELYTNFFKGYVRFKKEILRMAGMEAYVLCEFPYSDIINFPGSMCLSKFKTDEIKYTSQHIIDRIEKFEGCGVRFLFCEDRGSAEREAYKILKEFYEKH